MNVHIYQPGKSTMQSGPGRKLWYLEYEREIPSRPEPLMGWTEGDALNQVRLQFETREQAIAFAERKGWTYNVQLPALHHVKPKNYADNFRPDRIR